MLAAAVLALAGTADAQYCDLDGTNVTGGIVSLRVDEGNGFVDYSILVNDVGSITSGRIVQGSAVFLDLGAVATIGPGISVGTTAAAGANLATLNDNPGDYAVVVGGDPGASVSLGPLVRAPSSCAQSAAAPVDLAVIKLKVKPKRRGTRLGLKATIRNRSASPSAATEVAFYASLDPVLNAGDQLLATVSLPAIDPNRKRRAKDNKVVVPASLVGEYYILVEADPNHDNLDPAPGNNILVTAGPVRLN